MVSLLKQKFSLSLLPILEIITSEIRCGRFLMAYSSTSDEKKERKKDSREESQSDTESLYTAPKELCIQVHKKFSSVWGQSCICEGS